VRGPHEPAGVPSPGHALTDSPRTWETSSSPTPIAEVPCGRGRPETVGTGEEESYDPIVPRKVGNWRVAGTHWREGGNIGTSRFGDTWRHAEVEQHVHRTESVIRASQGRQVDAISLDLAI
jgi:hypothetical protein